MAKKKTPVKISPKAAKHLAFAKAMNKEFSTTFMVNRLLGNTLVENLAEVDPFVFVITIDVAPEITIVSVNVNGVIANAGNFSVADGKIKCEVRAIVAGSHFLLIIDAVGTAFATTTFNLTCDGGAVYNQDQTIRISQSGRGGFLDRRAPLP